MKNFLKTFGLHFGVFSVLVLTFGIAYAAWDSTVNTGDQLTASSWNQLVEKVKTMDSSLSFSGGSIGIGTSEHFAKLHVDGNSGLHEPGVFISADSTTWGKSPRIGLLDKKNGSIFSAPVWFIDNENDAFRIFRQPNVNTPGIEFIHISNNGNAGIGTINPSAKLEIKSNSSKILRLDSSSQDHGYIEFFTDKVNQTARTAYIGYPSVGSKVLTFNNEYDSGRIGFYARGLPRLVIENNGNISIGNIVPTQKLTINGAALASAWNTPSDVRLKTNIEELESPLEKLENIRGVSFDWKENSEHDIGVIAQEVESVLPEVVTTDDNGMKSVDYAKLTPLLIEAIKNQQKMIREVMQENTSLSQKIELLHTRVGQLEK